MWIFFPLLCGGIHKIHILGKSLIEGEYSIRKINFPIHKTFKLFVKIKKFQK